MMTLAAQKRAPGYSQANFHKAPSLIEPKVGTLMRQKTLEKEESKVVPPRRDARLGKKPPTIPKAHESHSFVGMMRQTGVVPQRSKHMMKFSVADKTNKLINRDVKTSDHLDMYTSTVNRTNARVNLDMQSKRFTGVPQKSVTMPFMWG